MVDEIPDKSTIPADPSGEPSPEGAFPVTLDPAGIPAFLRERPQWVLWRIEIRKCKPNKVPYQANGQRADHSDPSTWTDFETALERYGMAPDRYSGIGYVFSSDDHFTGIDFDDCIDPEGKIKPWAATWILRTFQSYSEFSPSGGGIKVWVRGSLPGHGIRRPHEDGKIEMYDRCRFFTVTGRRVPDTPDIAEANGREVEQLYRMLTEKKTEEKAAPRAAAIPPEIARKFSVSNGAGSLNDQEVIDTAKRASNAERIRKLWYGQWEGDYPSQSEADTALCRYLAFYCGPNGQDQIDRLIRQSKLYREKWDREDYRIPTIQKAIAATPEFYSGRRAAGDGNTAGEAAPPTVERGGLRADVLAGHQARTRSSATLDVHIGEKILRQVTVTSTVTNLDQVAREINGHLKDASIIEIKAFLRDAIAAAVERYATESGRSGGGSGRMVDIVIAHAEKRLALSYRADRRAWSERTRSFIFASNFLDEVLEPELLEKLTRAADAPPGRSTHEAIYSAAARAARAAWSRILRDLPEQPEAAAKLGEDSAAAADLADAVRRLWLVSATFELYGHSPGRLLASNLTHEAWTVMQRTEPMGHWRRVHENWAAWCRQLADPDSNERTYQLAMRHELFQQLKQPTPPGVRDFKSFRALMEGYGLGQADKAGGSTGHFIRLSAGLTQELSASLKEPGDDETTF